MGNETNILGIKLDPLTLPEALGRADGLISAPHFTYIVTPNPEFALQAQKDPSFRAWVNGADLSLVDGVGLIWASYFQNIRWPRSKLGRFLLALLWLPLSGLVVIFAPKKITKIIPERLSGSDVLIELIKLAAQKGYKIFLLGGGEGVAREASTYLRFLYPNLQVAGMLAGPPFQSEEFTLNTLKGAKPEIVFLALPQEKQMEWTKKVKEVLPRSCVMGIGGALDFIVGASALQDPTGKYKAVRAPYLMRQRGLEWLWRLVRQPWRSRRIFQAVVRFTGEVVKEVVSRQPIANDR